jgi:hypothetical protein
MLVKQQNLYHNGKTQEKNILNIQYFSQTARHIIVRVKCKKKHSKHTR